MPDLFDYLKWRADVPFSADPFNEVDNMILSELAYTCFEGMPEDDSEVTIKKAFDDFFAVHTREEMLSINSYTAKSSLLMEDMISGARFENTALFRYINEIDKENDKQIAAVTYLLDDGTAFVAFRGTDSTLVGWKEDFDLSYLSRTDGQKRAVEYLNGVGTYLDMPLRVGGHSKGGNFAVYASSFCEKSVRDRIINVYSNDGPGFRKEITESEGYNEILPRVISIVPDTSVIGMLLSNTFEHKVIKSTASGIYQHDGFTWQVSRNRFETSETTEAGRFIKNVLGMWVEKMTDDDRRTLTSSLFTLFEATGKNSFTDMGEQKWKTFEAIVSSLPSLPKESRKDLMRIAGLLLKSGGRSAAEMLPSRNKKAEPKSE